VGNYAAVWTVLSHSSVLSDASIVGTVDFLSDGSCIFFSLKQEDLG